MRLRVISRLLEIQRVLVWHRLDEFVRATHLYRPLRFIFFLSPWTWFERGKDAPRGVRLRLALEELGPIFVKFGQALSTRRDLLPLDIADELEPLRARGGSEQSQRVADAPVQVERRALERQLPRLDFRIVEDVVDDAQERTRRRGQHVHVLPLFARKRGVVEELRHAEHAVHGRTELVAHVGEELRFDSGGGGGRTLEIREFRADLRQLGRAILQRLLEPRERGGQRLWIS